jgi:dienelactone hydrolase
VKTIVLFHSMLGLRQVERDAADRMRTTGYEVQIPDLYAGQFVNTLEEGFELKDRVGWATICDRAAQAVRDLPDTTVLAGFSMGAGVVADLWTQRPRTAGVLLFHGLADIPPTAMSGLPVQVHLANHDPFVPSEQRSTWRANARQLGLAAQVFEYPDTGHFFSDPNSLEYDAEATHLTWQRTIEFLERIDFSRD